MSERYVTPHYDAAMEKNGWTRHQEHPIYWRKTADPEYSYEIGYNGSFTGHQLIYEEWVQEGKVKPEQLVFLLRKDGFRAAANLWRSKELTYKILLEIAKDFYLNNFDKIMYNKCEELLKQTATADRSISRPA